MNWFAYVVMLVCLAIVLGFWLETLVRTGVINIRWPR